MNACLCLALVSLLALGCSSAAADSEAKSLRAPQSLRDGSVRSSDGVEIHYLFGGAGERALVFVHGWLGNATWWKPAMVRFAPRYRVVALDLAGHGASGKERADWTVERFADDVAAVVRALDLEHVALIGHSMSGAITVAAASQLGERVDLLVPVDTLQDAEWDLPPEVWSQFFGGLRADFAGSVENFFRNMLSAPSSPKEVIDALVADARTADPALAVPMLERAREYDLRAGLRALRVPIHAINSNLNPTNLETNKKYAPRFDVEVISGVGHWPMLEDPRRFENALASVLETKAEEGGASLRRIYSTGW